MIPLNQSYRVKATLKAYPRIAEIKREFELWITSSTDYHKAGRTYDDAITLYRIDFTDKKVCELGARDSFLSPYLTKVAASVDASDIFTGWGDLGTIMKWRGLWMECAINPDRLRVSKRDMRDTAYKDNMFDVVVSFSAIEHIAFDGDIKAAREMARICKPGGFVVIGTDMAATHRFSNGYFYDAQSLFDRIINPTGCVLFSEHDFSWARADHSKSVHQIFFSTCCIFVLRKPI